MDDGLDYCTSVLERTVTIERTIEHTISLGGNSQKYANTTSLKNDTVASLTSLIEATPDSISAGLPCCYLQHSHMLPRRDESQKAESWEGQRSRVVKQLVASRPRIS